MVIPPLFCQVNFLFTGTGVPTGAQMTLGLDNPAVDDPLVVASVVAGLWDTPATDMRSIYSTTTTLSGIMVKNGPNATGASDIYPVSFTGTQNASGNPSTSILVKKVTSFGGRQGSGRMFFPGIAESDVDQSGVVLPGRITAAQPVLDVFRDGLVAAGYTPVLLHNDDTSPMIINRLLMTGQCANQRRRNRR